MEGNGGIQQDWHFQHHAQGLNCMLLYRTVPTGSTAMAYVELDECIRIYSSFFFPFFFFKFTV